MQRHDMFHRDQRKNADRRAIAEMFPAALRKHGADRPKVPLAIGIHVDLIAALRAANSPITTRRMHAMLHDYLQSVSYLRALARGGQRYDLAGNPRGSVDADVQQCAKDKLARMGIPLVREAMREAA